nr:hypothetical protein [Tanacetum cinerariifolium]
EILNESPIKTGVTEETSNTLDGCGMRQFRNDIDFGFVDLNPVFGNLMAKENALFDHKVAFLPLEGLKDALMDVIMAAVYLESDTGGDAPQFIRDLRPSSSQFAIPVSDGVPVSVATEVPQGLALLLVDAATQTDFEDA